MHICSTFSVYLRIFLSLPNMFQGILCINFIRVQKASAWISKMTWQRLIDLFDFNEDYNIGYG